MHAMLKGWKEHYQQLEIDAQHKEGILSAIDGATNAFDEANPDTPEFESAMGSLTTLIDQAFESGVLSDAVSAASKSRYEKWQSCRKDAKSAADRRKCDECYRDYVPQP